MKIGFIGAGKVGFTLGRLFVSGGLPVIGYYSRQRGSAKEAADFTQTKVFDSLAEIVSECDVLFLTVPDGAMVPVYQDLCQFDLSGKQLCHCSGAMSADEAFEGLAAKGGEGYSIHPLFPVSNKFRVWQELMGGFFVLREILSISRIGKCSCNRLVSTYRLSMATPRSVIMRPARSPAI